MRAQRQWQHVVDAQRAAESRDACLVRARAGVRARAKVGVSARVRVRASVRVLVKVTAAMHAWLGLGPGLE